VFESPKRHHLSRAPLALTPGRDKPEDASAWEFCGYAVGSTSRCLWPKIRLGRLVFERVAELVRDDCPTELPVGD